MLRRSRVRCFQNIQCGNTAGDTIVTLLSCTKCRTSLTRTFTLASILQYYFCFSSYFLLFILCLLLTFLLTFLRTYLPFISSHVILFLSFCLVFIPFFPYLICFVSSFSFLNVLQNFPSFFNLSYVVISFVVCLL
jgi:cytochrome bd-type quinol oxidase subunit 2